MTETREVERFPGYFVSADGRLYGMRSRWGRSEPREMKLRLSGHGYPCCDLRDADGRTRKLLIHCAVAAAFIGPKPSGHQVNHRDGNKANNAAENLEYVTPAANVAHALRMGLNASGERCGAAKLTAEIVAEIRRRRAGGETYKAIAATVGVAPSTVRFAAKGQSWRR